MKITKLHWIGIFLSVVIMMVSIGFLSNINLFFLLIGTSLLVGISPFVFSVIYDIQVTREKEEMFLEFARNLVESVKAGTPISKSIIHVKGKSYGVLSENITKLANQISLGIPLNSAFKTFARDIDNKAISRAIILIRQAEMAGGDIGEILEAVAGAVNMSDKLKKEREASIDALVIQGYIIFFVFTIIVLVMQFKILPMVEGITDFGTIGSAQTSGAPINETEVNNSFLYLLLVQGFFSGLAIGKLSGGGIKSGVRHSFSLMFTSFFISAISNLFIGA